MEPCLSEALKYRELIEKMKKEHRIIVLPGDGIGPEIVNAALEVLEAVQNISGEFKLSYEFYDAGAGRWRDKGEAIGEDALAAFEKVGIAFKGPVGLPDMRLPDGTEAGLLGGILRVGFDLYANVRPVRLFPNVSTPLAATSPGDIDYILLRENTEGLYLSRGIGLVRPQAATDTLLMTAEGCERIVRMAFNLAMERGRGAPDDGIKRVTLVDKSNVLRSFAFLRRIFLELAGEYPDISSECIYVDAAAASLVSRPGHFNVIVTENLFGDILSDLGGATVGGLGMCPSANIGVSHAYFEPIHGSAPQIAGKNLANPISQILAAAMMLRHLGENKASDLLETCVWMIFNDKKVLTNPEGQIIGGSTRVVQELKRTLKQFNR